MSRISTTVVRDADTTKSQSTPFFAVYTQFTRNSKYSAEFLNLHLRIMPPMVYNDSEGGGGFPPLFGQSLNNWFNMLTIVAMWANISSIVRTVSNLFEGFLFAFPDFPIGITCP